MTFLAFLQIVTQRRKDWKNPPSASSRLKAPPLIIASRVRKFSYNQGASNKYIIGGARYMSCRLPINGSANRTNLHVQNREKTDQLGLIRRFVGRNPYRTNLNHSLLSSLNGRLFWRNWHKANMSFLVLGQLSSGTCSASSRISGRWFRAL